ncbi:MAG: bifunctional ADP-heptose synthase [Saprospiraceae bacterium]
MKIKQEELQILKQDLRDLHILVIGDIMLDRYILGSATRISPEAPVPVVLWKETEDKLGGASNVVSNLKSMGCTASLMGICGNDPEGKTLENLLKEIACDHLYLIVDPDRPTTLKTRIIADQHQIVRVDHESEQEISKAIQDECLQTLKQIFTLKKVDVLILQDYNKGFLHAGWIPKIIELARLNGVKIAVDPKKNNFFEFKGVQLFKPNLKEAIQATEWSPKHPTDLEHLSKLLKSKLLCDRVMITLAAEGIWIDSKAGKKKYPTNPRKVADVSGAGDTVISLAAICLAYSLSDEFMAYCCNTGGGQVCERSGVVPVVKSALIKELED